MVNQLDFKSKRPLLLIRKLWAL